MKSQQTHPGAQAKIGLSDLEKLIPLIRRSPYYASLNSHGEWTQEALVALDRPLTLPLLRCAHPSGRLRLAIFAALRFPEGNHGAMTSAAGRGDLLCRHTKTSSEYGYGIL
jgi:hypothetical protein